MYHKGDLEYAVDQEALNEECMSDARETDGYTDGFLKAPLVYLPHSCDQWIIGGPDPARQLIADLWRAIQQMEWQKRESPNHPLPPSAP